MRTVVGLFDTTAEANAAIERLHMAGIDGNEVSVVAREGTDIHHVSEEAGHEHLLSDAGVTTGLVSGAAIGAAAGLALVGSSVLLPGLGTFLIAGPLAAALTGAGIGAASGGIIGGLTGVGVPESEAEHFSSGMERGKILVSARADSTQIDEVRKILDEEGSTRSYATG